MWGVKLVNVSNGNKVQTRIEMSYSLLMQALMIGRITTSNSFTRTISYSILILNQYVEIKKVIQYGRYTKYTCQLFFKITFFVINIYRR